MSKRHPKMSLGAGIDPISLITLEGEVWKEIEGFKDYKVSNLGRIWSCIRCIVLKVGKTTRGTARVSLSKRDAGKGMTTALVATIAARAFLDNPTGSLYVKHIDGDRMNCAVDNLEWDLDPSAGSKKLESYDKIQREVKNASGAVHKITNLTNFCNEYGLKRESMRRVLLGETKVHRGWMLA